MSVLTNIYFDVDGVFNAQSTNPPRHPTGWTGDWTTAQIAQVTVTWSHELVAAINELVTRPNVRPVWLTSWEDEAPKFLCPAIGLNGADWPVLHGVAGDASFAWWKLDAIREDVDRNPPSRVIWVDDEFAVDRHAPAWAATAPVPVLTISPKKYLGLTRNHLKQIAGFLAE